MNIKEVESLILKSISLACLNLVAFVYDGEWIPFALGVDALMLGVEVKNHIGKKE